MPGSRYLEVYRDPSPILLEKLDSDVSVIVSQDEQLTIFTVINGEDAHVLVDCLDKGRVGSMLYDETRPLGDLPPSELDMTGRILWDLLETGQQPVLQRRDGSLRVFGQAKNLQFDPDSRAYGLSAAWPQYPLRRHSGSL